jgi:hypothetical protein
MHDDKSNNFYIKHFFLIFQIKKLQRLYFDNFVPLGILVLQKHINNLNDFFIY